MPCEYLVGISTPLGACILQCWLSLEMQHRALPGGFDRFLGSRDGARAEFRGGGCNNRQDRRRADNSNDIRPAVHQGLPGSNDQTDDNRKNNDRYREKNLIVSHF
jgi:hypothetical protein